MVHGPCARLRHDLRLRTRLDRPPQPCRVGRAVDGRGLLQGVPRDRQRVASDRGALRRSIDRLAEGDVLIVTRLDRLARSTRGRLTAQGGSGGSKCGTNHIAAVAAIRSQVWQARYIIRNSMELSSG
ncbi:recombinase family protein [Methylobacterium sp. WL120]|uniref:recombinase family protein n=1 Tax=Methylobacterium sp. WL120 TaxID=2603887 RepID=UPI001FEF8535|nr:recombinase family protein [Methylobacterium sp. WL120]